MVIMRWSLELVNSVNPINCILQQPHKKNGSNLRYSIPYSFPKIIWFLLVVEFFFINSLFCTFYSKVLYFFLQGSLKKNLDIKISLLSSQNKSLSTKAHTNTLAVRAQLKYVHRNKNAGLTLNLIKSRNEEKNRKQKHIPEGLRSVKIYKTIRYAGN